MAGCPLAYIYLYQALANLGSHISESLQRNFLKRHRLTKFGTINRFMKKNFCFNEKHKKMAILRDIVEKVSQTFGETCLK